MKNLKFLLIGAIAVFCTAGCPEPEKDTSWVGTFYTKAEIEAEVDATWEQLGYTAKPTKYIALSFDDGPNSGTPAMLAALEELKVKATFFVIGSNVRNNKARAQDIFDAGHELANHSDGTSPLGGATIAAIETSLEAASAAIKEITGEDPIYFRAPNVNYGANLTTVCTEMGMAIIGVNVWSDDWQGTTADVTANNVINRAQPNGIINCHELANTTAALPAMIEGLRAKGYWILTVGQLAAVREKTLVAGTQYDSIN